MAGRWTARDPALFDGHQANVYAYAGNDPVGQRDPSGLFSLGASLYSVGGVGAKISVTGEGCSVCVEAGVGGGVSLDPFGGLDDNSNGVVVQAEATVTRAGIVGIGAGAQLTPCAHRSRHGTASSYSSDDRRGVCPDRMVDEQSPPASQVVTGCG